MRAESEREKVRANLLRAISHDLRTPLTSIYGSCSAIMENYDRLKKEQTWKLLGEMKEDAEWLIRMVENLLSVTRLDGNAASVVKRPIVLEELIDAVLVKFKKRYPNQPVQVQIPDQFVSIPMDAMLIEQVLINILENAVFHAGNISFFLSAFSCPAHGPFLKSPTTDAASPETGSIPCSQVIVGRALLPQTEISTAWESAFPSVPPSFGPTVETCKRKAGQAKERSCAFPWRRRMWNMSNNKYKIMVMEDESNIRSFMETILETNGYQVLTAGTCSQGICMFSSHAPDLVILDLGLPDMDGLEFIRAIRKTSVVPIVVVSARTTEQDKIFALDLGANDYITKPFGTGELLARVRAALRNSRHSAAMGAVPGGTFSAGGLTIDYDRRQVWICGREIKLTQTEYNIVALLSEHAGKVVTYAALAKAIWGGADHGSTKSSR